MVRGRAYLDYSEDMDEQKLARYSGKAEDTTIELGHAAVESHH